MSMQLGIMEIVIVGAVGLLCVGLPIGILAMVLVGKGKREK